MPPDQTRHHFGRPRACSVLGVDRCRVWRWQRRRDGGGDLEDRSPGGNPIHALLGGLDVLVCHDAPKGTTGLVSGLPWKMPTGLQREADGVQALVRSAVDATEPAVVFHGHWHQPNRCRLNARSEVVGLDADGSPKSAAVLSISDLHARYTDPMQRSHRH